MTTETNAAAGALSDGIDLRSEGATLDDIKAMADEIVAHVDLHDVGEIASAWLANAVCRALDRYYDRKAAERRRAAAAELATPEMPTS